MRIPSTLKRSDIGINLTPMIDVVFQLIIFFLVSSHLVKQEAQMELPLPIAASGEELDEESGKRLILNVLADGSLILAGRPIEQRELELRLSDAARRQQGLLEVRIRGDRTVPYRFIEPVLVACARSGLWDVKFSVHRAEDLR
jgi:biopolymer transport protein ExbD